MSTSAGTPASLNPNGRVPSPAVAPPTTKFLWMDGRLIPWDEAAVHPSRLGWSTIGAVFEGIKAYWNAEEKELYGWQFREHYARFQQSMRFERMRPEFTPEQLVEASCELLRANGCREDVYVRPLAWHPDATWFGHHEESRTGIVITTAPFKSILGSGKTVRTCVSTWTRIGDNQLSPRVKCLSNYQNSRKALLEAVLDGYDQPIILNALGKVTEGPASCVFLVRDGVVITPALTSGILESITRTAVLRLCKEELGLETMEREVDRTELYVADELFFCGTGAEIMPIGEVDHYVAGDGGVGPITGKIDRLFHEVVRGGRPEYGFWRMPVYANFKAPAAAA